MKNGHLLKIIITGIAINSLTISTAFAEKETSKPLERIYSFYVEPFIQNKRDEIIWGCFFASHTHTYGEKMWRNYPRQVPYIETYLAWYETEGKPLLAKWKNGEPLTDEEELYLPVVKCTYWNAVEHENKIKYSIHKGRAFKKPAATDTLNIEFQALHEKALPVVHKIWNSKPLTQEEKFLFQDWLIAYYTHHYIGGVHPRWLPSDSWTQFSGNLMGGLPAPHKTNIQFGNPVYNLKIYDPLTYWNDPEVDMEKLHRTKHLEPLHLYAEKNEELIREFQHMASFYESTGTYPLLKSKEMPKDAPNKDHYFSIYNMLKDGKPILFSNWMIDDDEGNRQIGPHLALYYRVFKEKMNFLFTTPVINCREGEKNNHYHASSIEEQYREVLFGWMLYPELPQPYYCPAGFIDKGHGYRVAFINPKGELIGKYGENRDVRKNPLSDNHKNAAIGNRMAGILNIDKSLSRCFKNGFTAENYALEKEEKTSKYSTIEGRAEQMEANGYSLTAYDPYQGCLNVIGIVVEVTANTVTVLQDEYRDEDYPVLEFCEKFPTLFNSANNKYKTYKYEDLAARKKAGNSKEARTKVFNINRGVIIAINGDEQESASTLKKGDVVSVLYLKDKAHPRLIRCLRIAPKQSIRKEIE